jgi:putative hydrolase of the HAD superfamily
MSTKIKFIFFDMGKVLLNFDHQILVDQVAQVSGLTVEEADQLLFHAPHDLENRFERGELDDEQFHSAFRDLSGKDVDKDVLMLAMSDMFWLNTSIVPLLTRLVCLNFPMAILSNTCSAHWDFAKRNFAAIGMFNHRVLSYEEKSMKPDPMIYQAAIEMAKGLVSCEANEIFFTDDKQENVDAARQAGIQAELFTSARELNEQLADLGIPVS